MIRRTHFRPLPAPSPSPQEARALEALAGRPTDQLAAAVRHAPGVLSDLASLSSDPKAKSYGFAAIAEMLKRISAAGIERRSSGASAPQEWRSARDRFKPAFQADESRSEANERAAIAKFVVAAGKASDVEACRKELDALRPFFTPGAWKPEGFEEVRLGFSQLVQLARQVNG